MTNQQNQTIKWYNYWWALKPIRRQTIKNITADGERTRGEWTDDGGAMHRVTKSPSDKMWTLA